MMMSMMMMMMIMMMMMLKKVLKQRGFYFVFSIWAGVSEPKRQEFFKIALAATAHGAPPPRHGAVARSVPA